MIIYEVKIYWLKGEFELFHFQTKEAKDDFVKLVQEKLSDDADVDEVFEIPVYTKTPEWFLKREEIN